MTLLGSVESRSNGKTYYWLSPDVDGVNTGLGYKNKFVAQGVALRKAMKLGYKIKWEKPESEKR